MELIDGDNLARGNVDAAFKRNDRFAIRVYRFGTHDRFDFIPRLSSADPGGALKSSTDPT